MESFPSSKQPNIKTSSGFEQFSSPTTWDNIARKAEPFNARPESRPVDQEKIEKKAKEVRSNLIKTFENYADTERSAFGHLSDTLKKTSFSGMSRYINDFSACATRVDKSQGGIIGGFVDAKFSSDPKQSARQDELFREHRDGIVERAESLEKTLGTLSGALVYYGLDDAASVLRGMINPPEGNSIKAKNPNSIPEARVGLMQAYRRYTDTPSEQGREVLAKQVEEFTKIVRGGLKKLTATIPPTIEHSRDICNNIEEIGQTVQYGYKNMFEATVNDVDFRKNNPSKSTPQGTKSFREAWSTTLSSPNYTREGYKPAATQAPAPRRPSMLSTEGIV